MDLVRVDIHHLVPVSHCTEVVAVIGEGFVAAKGLVLTAVSTGAYTFNMDIFVPL